MIGFQVSHLLFMRQDNVDNNGQAHPDNPSWLRLLYKGSDASLNTL